MQILIALLSIAICGIAVIVLIARRERATLNAVNGSPWKRAVSGLFVALCVIALLSFLMFLFWW